jgi:hypothetical protein
LKRAYHHLALTRFRNETERTEIEGLNKAATVLLGGQYHHRNRGIALAQLGQHGETVAIWQVQVKQDEFGMLRNDLHRLVAT